MGQYTVITKDAGFPEATTGTDNDHKYATAWPIDEHRFLVVHDPDSNAHGLTNKRFGIYLIDDQGNKKQLYKDAAHSCLDPIPLAPRQTPPVVPMSRTGKSTDMAEVNLLNVYDSMLPMPSGVEIKALRVVQLYPIQRSEWTRITRHRTSGEGRQRSLPLASRQACILPGTRRRWHRRAVHDVVRVRRAGRDPHHMPGLP